MKKILLSIAAAVVAAFGVSSLLTPASVYADNPADKYLTGENSVNPGMPGEGEQSLMSMINTILNLVIGLVGVVAVVMMIIGGISFITSQGDTNKVTKARNTILYGVVGLIIAILAFAIVNFVIDGLFNTEGVYAITNFLR